MKKPSTPKLVGYPVFIQDWEESDEGFVRPDGCSLHLTSEDQVAFCKAALEKQRAVLGPKVPPEYSRLGGRASKVLVTENLFSKIEASASEQGIRVQQWNMKELKKEILLP